MKFSCLSNELSSALLNTSKVVANRSTLEVMEGILLDVKSDSICVVGYNFDIAITTSISAKVEEVGKMVLSAKLFTEIIRRMPEGVIEFESMQDLHLKITCNNMEFDIVGMEAQTYPDLPVVATEHTINMNAEKFRDLVSKTIYAASTDETKLIYTGALINFKAQKIAMVALDGFRMAVKEVAIESEVEASVICPSRSLQEVIRLITNADQEILIDVSNTYMMFRVNNYTIIAKLLEGRFLDYKATITKKFSTQIVVKTQEIIDSIERTAVVVQNKLKAPIMLGIEDKKLKMACRSTTGTASDEITCSTNGEQLVISFNSRLLLEALRAANCEEVSLNFSGSLTPAIIHSAAAEDDFLFLVLPVRNLNQDTESE